MTDHPRAIDLGDGGNLTEDSAEVVRVWVTDRGGASVWIDASLLENPRVFGYLIADTIRHGAQAYAEKTGKSPDEMLDAISGGVAEMLGGTFEDHLPPEGKLN